MCVRHFNENSKTKLKKDEQSLCRIIKPFKTTLTENMNFDRRREGIKEKSPTVKRRDVSLARIPFFFCTLQIIWAGLFFAIIVIFNFTFDFITMIYLQT